MFCYSEVNVGVIGLSQALDLKTVFDPGHLGRKPLRVSS
jgi:hypothetical protein